MKKNGPMIFVLILLIIASLTYVSLSGVKLGSTSIAKVSQKVKWGMDLNGGIYASYQAKGFNGKKVTSEDLSKTKDIMRARLDSRNLFDASVTTDNTNKRIIVEIPSVKASEELMNILGKPSVLVFKGPDGKKVLSGSDIKSASADIASDTNTHVVSLEMNSSGKEKFAKATEKYLNKNIAIVVDGRTVSNPTVETVITDGKAQIEGMKDAEEATSLASNISSGALPVNLKVVQSRIVDSILGKDAKDLALKGGFIAVCIVLIFMLVFYKLPGLIADVALIFYTLIVVDIISYAGISLTISGLAGVILGIGMAVDANVIIFERMKEELRWGKSLKAAVEAGFNRAWTAILDGNVTTLIAAAVLYLLGSGSIKGFAITLGLGVVVSMFTAITITRLMLRSLMSVGYLKNHKLFD